MAQYKVNTQQLRSKATELRTLNSRFHEQVENLKSQEAQLHGMWEGDAHDEFHKAFEKDIIQMNNFYNAIEKYIGVLENLAVKYDSTEIKNRNIASERNY